MSSNTDKKIKKIVLAYSGGLDTSAIIPWLLDQGFEVHCLLVDVGQQDDFAASCEKALMLGATTAFNEFNGKPLDGKGAIETLGDQFPGPQIASHNLRALKYLR